MGKLMVALVCAGKDYDGLTTCEVQAATLWGALARFLEWEGTEQAWLL